MTLRDPIEERVECGVTILDGISTASAKSEGGVIVLIDADDLLTVKCRKYCF